jgi:hypothetical protein
MIISLELSFGSNKNLKKEIRRKSSELSSEQTKNCN